MAAVDVAPVAVLPERKESEDAAEAASALASVSLPAAVVRRIARSAAPGARFSGESVAALHRVAQIFVCYLTDRSLHEMKVEADKMKKSKKNPAMPKTLKSDHVMRFLSTELPPISKKISTLFPFAVPPEYKPAGVRLLERLHEQNHLANLGKDGGSSSLLTAFGAGQQADEPVSAVVIEPAAVGAKRSREADGKEKPAKRAKAEKAAPKPAPKPKAAPAKLSSFFGAKDKTPAVVNTPATAHESEQASLDDTCAQPQD